MILRDDLNAMERAIKEGDNPVEEVNKTWQNPEYHKTRGTLWEVGGTTLQG